MRSKTLGKREVPPPLKMILKLLSKTNGISLLFFRVCVAWSCGGFLLALSFFGKEGGR